MNFVHLYKVPNWVPTSYAGRSIPTSKILKIILLQILRNSVYNFIAIKDKLDVMEKL